MLGGREGRGTSALSISCCSLPTLLKELALKAVSGEAEAKGSFVFPVLVFSGEQRTDQVPAFQVPQAGTLSTPP